MEEVSKSRIRAHNVIEEAKEHVYDVTILDKTILTTVTKYPEVVTEWIKVVDEEADNNTYIGLAVEMYTNEERTITLMGTLQLCDGKRCLIFQMLHCVKEDCPPTLEKFLMDEKYVFFGIQISRRLMMLAEKFSFIRDKNRKALDLIDLAMRVSGDPEMLFAEQSDLVWMTLGKTVEKPPQVDKYDGEWGSTGRLSDAHVQYACLDAFLNLEVGRCLNVNSPCRTIPSMLPAYFES